MRASGESISCSLVYNVIHSLIFSFTLNTFFEIYVNLLSQLSASRAEGGSYKESCTQACQNQQMPLYVSVCASMCSTPFVWLCVRISAGRHHDGCHMGAVTPLTHKQPARLTWVGCRSRHTHTHTHTHTLTHRNGCHCIIKVESHLQYEFKV